MPSDPLLAIVLTSHPETVYEFTGDSERRTFGRDPGCDVVVPAPDGDRALSRVAGVVWRMEDQLWVRNLSAQHELQVDVPGRPVEPPLPPRRDDGVDRGAARSIPPPLAYVRGPGGCELLVRQFALPEPPDPQVSDEAGETVRAPDLPAELRPVAVALCAPLVSGRQLPASYSQIASSLELTPKSVRLQVEKMCRLYADALPELRHRIEARRAAEEHELGVGAAPRLVGGIWVFDSSDAPAERQRVRALALPDYFEVAHLLVRRGIISECDLRTAP